MNNPLTNINTYAVDINNTEARNMNVTVSKEEYKRLVEMETRFCLIKQIVEEDDMKYGSYSSETSKMVDRLFSIKRDNEE